MMHPRAILAPPQPGKSVFGTATLPTGASEPSPRGEAVIYRPFGTATLPRGISAKNPQGCIDYVFLLNNGVKCKVRHYEVPMTFENGGDVTVASDHLPVFVEVEF